MSFENKTQKLLGSVLKKIKPTTKEIQDEKEFADKIIEKIKNEKGEHTEVVLAGSIARGTHLKNDRDMDIFVLYPDKLDKKEFEKKAEEIGKKISPKTKWEKVFTEHPYVRGEVDGYIVEIVPSYKVEKTSDMKSAVDRSPFHTQYLQEKLTEKQKDEIRLLRQFLKGIKAYGAEIKTESFPGYVTELLVLHYGSFLNVIKDASEWKKQHVIDIEKHLMENERHKFTDSHLTIIDPVDKDRNVAAALSLNQMARFCLACREFLKKPSEKFFFAQKQKNLTEKQAKTLIEKEGLIVIEIGYPQTVNDVVWGQLKRFSKKIQNELEQKEFNVLRREVFTDEKKYLTIVFDLKANILEKVMKRIGPEVFDKKNCEQFLLTHKKTISGPRIENGRIVVEIERHEWQAEKLLEKLLLKEKKTEKKEFKKALQKKASVLTKKEVIAKYKKDKEFQDFFSNYLNGKESFL